MQQEKTEQSCKKRLVGAGVDNGIGVDTGVASIGIGLQDHINDSLKDNIDTDNITNLTVIH